MSTCIAAAFLLLSLASAVCANIFSPAIKNAPVILIAAAADLAPLEAPLTQAVARSAGLQCRFVLGSSGLLARQIAQGAPYDVFLSANQQFIDDLARAGRLAPDSVRLYAYGRIALWSKNGAVRSLADLGSRRVLHLAIPNPEHAPYGVAARQALEKQGLWTALQPKILYGENVRQVLEYAESGNADAVITAWSLLIGRGILLPESWHDPIRQAGAVLTGSSHPQEARRFLDFLCGPAGQAILSQHGLTAK